MTRVYDAVVIGAGHNGLVTAAYLARGGLSTLVLERREIVGGAAVTEPVFPGFKVDVGAHAFSAIHPAILSELKLRDHGLDIIRPDPTVFAPLPDGRHLSLRRDPRQTAEALRSFSRRDADNWPVFCQQMATVAGFLERIYQTTPLRVPHFDRDDLWKLVRLGGGLRRMGKKAMAEVLRTLPMSVAELLNEWFETDVLKGTLGAAGTIGAFQGPMAAGTAFAMLHHQVGSAPGALRAAQFARGGMGTLTGALRDAARANGAEITTGAAVASVAIADGTAQGVVLDNGDEIRARRIVSNLDPRRTFFDLVGPTNLEPEFVRAIRSIKFRGATAKVHLALDTLPTFSALPDTGRHLEGLISIGPSLEYLERAFGAAKYGDMSERPFLEATIPTLTEPAMAPPGRHIMSILVRYAPYRLNGEGWADRQRERLADVVIDTLAEYAPGIRDVILHRHVLSPVDLESTFGLTEGSIYHGELTLDQVYFMRPTPSCAQYRTPIANLYLCGAGTHPGGGVSGMPGYNAAREILKGDTT